MAEITCYSLVCILNPYSLTTKSYFIYIHLSICFGFEEIMLIDQILEILYVRITRTIL